VRYLDSKATDNNPFNATITSMSTSISSNRTRLRLFLENPIFTGPVSQSSYNGSTDDEGHYHLGFDHNQARIQAGYDKTYRGWIPSDRYELDVQISTSALQKITDVKNGEPMAAASNVTRSVARPALPDIIINDYTNSGTDWNYGPQGSKNNSSSFYGMWFYASRNFFINEILVRATPGTRIQAYLFTTDNRGDRDYVSEWRAAATSVSDEIYTSIDIPNAYIVRGGYYGVAIRILNSNDPDAYYYTIASDEPYFYNRNNPNEFTRDDLRNNEGMAIRHDFYDYYYGAWWGSGSPKDFQDSPTLPDIAFD